MTYSVKKKALACAAACVIAAGTAAPANAQGMLSGGSSNINLIGLLASFIPFSSDLVNAFFPGAVPAPSAPVNNDWHPGPSRAPLNSNTNRGPDEFTPNFDFRQLDHRPVRGDVPFRFGPWLESGWPAVPFVPNGGQKWLAVGRTNTLRACDEYTRKWPDPSTTCFFKQGSGYYFYGIRPR